MPNIGKVIGIAGNQTIKRIPVGTTITYSHGTARTLTVFNSIAKSVDHDVSQTTGNDGEWINERKRNSRIECHVECKVTGANEAAVFAILSDPPERLDLLTLATTVEDTQLENAEGSWYVNSKVDVSYTPDNDAIIAFDAICRTNDDGSALTVSVLS